MKGEDLGITDAVGVVICEVEVALLVDLAPLVGDVSQRGREHTGVDEADVGVSCADRDADEEDEVTSIRGTRRRLHARDRALGRGSPTGAKDPGRPDATASRGEDAGDLVAVGPRDRNAVTAADASAYFDHTDHRSRTTGR